MSTDLEQRIIDTVATLHAESGGDVPQSTVQLRFQPLLMSKSDRRTLSDAIDALMPRLLERGGTPVVPTLRAADPSLDDLATAVDRALAAHESNQRGRT